MSLWSRISEALAALSAGEGLAAIFDKLRAPPERSVAMVEGWILGVPGLIRDGVGEQHEPSGNPCNGDVFRLH